MDGYPIVVIATGVSGKRSRNRKTGKMVQIYVLRRDMNPIKAIRTGADYSICGDCVHRGGEGGKGRTCYVDVGRSVFAVWRAYASGRYDRVTPLVAQREFAGGLLRIGAYGDPAAVPWELWAVLTAKAKGWTGYTHQWKRTDDVYQRYLMASVDTPDEATHAQSLGWRTFRVGLNKFADEISCPASEEAGKKKQCADCLLCMGTTRTTSKNVTIQPHGRGAKRLKVVA